MFESTRHVVGYAPFIAQLNGGLALGPEKFTRKIKVTTAKLPTTLIRWVALIADDRQSLRVMLC